jgi:hypothetical protein
MTSRATRRRVLGDGPRVERGSRPRFAPPGDVAARLSGGSDYRKFFVTVDAGGGFGGHPALPDPPDDRAGPIGGYGTEPFLGWRIGIEHVPELVLPRSMPGYRHTSYKVTSTPIETPVQGSAV